MQLVLLPHLLSFADGCNEIQQETEELAQFGWYSLHSGIPFAPGRNIPRGCAPKAGGKKRPTSEAGAPRKRQRMFKGNEPVISQNESIKQTNWYHEWKPSVAMLIQAMDVLLNLASMSSQPRFFFSDDEAKCFDQLRLASEQYSSAMTLLIRDQDPSWAADYVIPFGIACASQIAQAWGHVLMHIVRDTMDKMEAAAEFSAQESEWVQCRSNQVEQFEQQRAYYAELYTYDSAAAVVGVPRMVRYLLARFEVTTRFNIMIVPPAKRQLGCNLTWVGIIFLACGLITISMQKRIRGIHSLKLFLANRLTLSKRQRLNGLLEHFMHAFALKRDMMANVYDGLGEEALCGRSLKEPKKIIPASERQLSVAGK